MHPLDLFKYCPKCGSSHFEIRNEKAKKCADCGFTYYFNSSAATVAFILNARNELLVCRRGKEPAKVKSCQKTIYICQSNYKKRESCWNEITLCG
jgi:NADH pyrophosphatase NudC (nudix superfamily)